MKLVFNSLHSGLANNGGSKTIIKCCEAINSLGHTCNIIAIKDEFIWFEHKQPIRYVPSDLDVMIAVANSDVVSTLHSNVDKKAWFIRGHETWSAPEYLLEDYYRNSNILNIVNSKGLQQKLATYGADSVVVYSGIDLGMWENRNLRSNDKIRIGCLYNSKPTKRWEDFVKLANILGTKDYEYIGIGDSPRNDDFFTGFWYNVSTEELNDIYSSCHIFFLPTVLEGLHNIGLEAALCGCLLVGNDTPTNGMVCDYLFDNETGMVYQSGDIQSAAELIRNPNWSLIPKAKKFIVENIGSRETNMKKFIDVLEEM